MNLQTSWENYSRILRINFSGYCFDREIFKSALAYL